MTAAVKAQIKRASAAGRARIRQLDSRTRAELKRLYNQARDDIERIIAIAEGFDGTVTLPHLNRLQQQIDRRLEQLTLNRDELLGETLREAVQTGIDPFIPSAITDLQQIADSALRQTIHFVARDGLQLSDRLWRINQATREIITNQVEQAIIRGDSAAKAAREFVSQGLEIPAHLQKKIGAAQASKIAGKTGAELMAKGSPYQNAMRLFRTELNRAHGEAYLAAAFESPDVIGTKFMLSPGHPEPDICDMHAKVNRWGLGPGVYPKGKNPWPAHPNTISFVVVVFADEVTENDRKGKQTRIDWLKQQSTDTQYHVLGSEKKVAALERGLLRENQIATSWKRLKAYYQKKGHDPDSWKGITAKPLPETDPPIRPLEELAGFIPQKTPKAAGQWAIENNLADYADYQGVAASVANEWNQSVYSHVTRFPDLRKNMKFIGTGQARNKRWRTLAVEDYYQRLKAANPDIEPARLRKIAEQKIPHPRVSGNVYAESTDHPWVSGVAINKRWGNDAAGFQRSLLSDVKTGWHPAGTDRVKAVIDHELGHQLDNLLSLSSHREIQDLYYDWRRNNAVTGDGLSRYGATTIAEFIAEAWAEYLNNPTPRTIARSVGKTIEKRYQELYG